MKKCAISGCCNNSKDHPSKNFFCSPTNKDRKSKWVATTGKAYSEKAKFYVCEDHFDMKEDVEYFTLESNRPRLVGSSVPHINIAGNQPPSNTTSVSSFVPHSSTVTFVPSIYSTVVVSCSITSTVTASATFTFTNFNETTTVDSSSSLIVSPIVTPQKRRIVTSSSSNEPTREISNEQSTTTISKETSGSIYEPGESDDEDESDSESDSDLDEFGDFVIDESRFSKDEVSVVCDLTIKAMRYKIQHYTGIPESSAYVIDLIEKMANVSRRNLFLVLRKIRHNETFVILGDLFGISAQYAAKIFSTDIVKVAEHLKAFIYWPDPKEIKWNLPLQFKHKYRNVQAIIDCFEISIAKPSNPVNQALSWSSYKHSNTMKYLIGSTPDGVIIFISKGFTGRISDNEIVRRSGFMKFVQEHCEILADRGFKDMEEDVTSKGGKLHKPPSTEAGKIYTPVQAKLCKSIAAVRIHIERVIGKIRNFNFLKPHHSLVNYKRTYVIEYSVIIASAISNMQGLLTKI